MTRPRLLFWCQHSVGLGHLVRSLALADGLRADFDVVLLNGGRFPEGIRVPDGVTVVNLPPLGHDGGYELVSRDDTMSVEAARERRVDLILAALREHRPSVVLLELFPFGRKKFAFELDPLLTAIRDLGAARPKVVCSVRDILVNQRRDQARHDERAARIANEHLDAILVHADPAFARLDESFRPETPLRVPVHYTGFVAPDAPAGDAPGDVADRLGRVLVSAGGGMVGEPLFRAAVGAHGTVHRRTGLTTTVVAGPFLPESAWAWLVEAAARSPYLEVVRRVDDLAGEIRRSAVSVSQCGYNTTMDLLRARTPAVVVPYSEGREDEQRRRAERLERLGVLAVVPAGRLAGDRLADAIVGAATAPRADVRLDLDGRTRSAQIVAELVRDDLGANRTAAPAAGRCRTDRGVPAPSGVANRTGVSS